MQATLTQVGGTEEYVIERQDYRRENELQRVTFTVKQRSDQWVPDSHRVEVYPPETATRWSPDRPAKVTWQSSGSNDGAEQALVAAEALRLAAQVAAELDLGITV